MSSSTRPPQIPHEKPSIQFLYHQPSSISSVILSLLFPLALPISLNLGHNNSSKFIIIIQKTYLLKNFQSFMKTKEIKSPKAVKINKRISEVETELHKNRVNLQKSDEEYLSPMHIKLPKNKGKNKKESKNSKNTEILQEGTTKRKQKKKVLHSFNGNTMISDNIELKDTMKDEKHMLKLKSKTTEKTFRNSSKNNSYKNNASSYQDLLISPKNYSKLTHSLKNFNPSTSQIKVPQQQYLILGDQFYLVNNYHPTKRLLNTFREVCNYQNSDSKFIMQDKGEKGKKKIEIKKNNIFLSARKQIQQKDKIKKAIKIQKWWRNMMKRHRLYEEKSNPEMIPMFNISPIKYCFDHDEINQVTPIKPYLQEQSFTSAKSPFQTNFQQQSKPQTDDIQIISFNSSDQINNKVKKIEFSKQDISKMLMKPFSLPQNNQIDPIQNQDIFNNYAKFRSQQLNQQFMQGSSEQNILSPQKDDSQSNQSSLNDIEEKSDANYDLLKQFQQAAQIKQLIEHRILFQKGQIKSLQSTASIGISTSILTVHNTLVSFFHYYINQHKQQFLSLINMPFGYSVYSRLRSLRGIQIPQEIEEDQSGVVYGLKDIIDDQKFEEYFEYVMKRDGKVLSSFAKANLQLEKIHFKAVLDNFNHELNQYRPYCQIDGVPYPWNHSWKALTFYYVTEQNIAEVFEKTELKVLKATSSLCGIILPLPKENKEDSQQKHFQMAQFVQQYQKNKHSLVKQHNQSKQVKFIHEQMKNQSFVYDSQTFTGILLQISNQIIDFLMFQISDQMQNIKTVDFTC